MAKGGNPNHDPRTGKFTSSGGFNRENSTAGDRIRGAARGTARHLGEFGKGLALGVVESAQQALFQGVAHAVKRHAAGVTGAAIKKYYPGAEESVIRHTSNIVGGIAEHSVRAAGSVSSTLGHVSSKLGEHASTLKKHLSGQSRPTETNNPTPTPRRPAMWQHEEPLKKTPRRRTLVIDKPFLKKRDYRKD